MNYDALFAAIKRIKQKGHPDAVLTQAEVDEVNGILVGSVGLAPIPPAIVTPALVGRRVLGDPDDFFAAVRENKLLFKGKLKQSQVDGMTMKLAEFGKAGWSTAWAACALATSFLESAATMQPVEEAFYLGARAEGWRQRNLRYYPWHGRGDVQITWEPNYRKADAALAKAGLISPGQLLANPKLAMRPDLAAYIMVKGMSEGWFAGDGKNGVNRHTLGRHLPGELGATIQFKASRRIINGVDRNDDLAAYAMGFQAALMDGDWRLA